MSQIKYTELDFALIKENLKNYLKSQDKFKDYNFDGSSMSILLDVLAYNTGYNGFYLNMLANEMFLDSASLRESVVSRAKHLGYTPRSAKSLSAIVDISIRFADGVPVVYDLLLTQDKQFWTTVNTIRYAFYPKKSVYFEQVSAREFVAKNVEIIEGKRFVHSWTVDTATPLKQRYIIPNSNVDISTIKVSVKESATNTNVTVFQQFEDLNLLKPTDPIYFLQQYEADKYEVVFGEGILGKSLVSGNIVNIEYIAATGGDALGATKFVGTSLFDNTGTPTITTIQKASGFVEPESIDSIKLLAPRAYDSQNRAVTKMDYETLLKRDIPNIEHIRVWGGEDNDPPMYGKVFCSIKPITGYSLNEDDRKSIIESYIRPRNVISVETIIVEPEYIRVALNTKVYYFASKTTKTTADIKSEVFRTIQTYRDTTLSGFDSDFRHSRLVKVIDAIDNAIESNLTEVKIKYRIIPSFELMNTFKIKLNNEIDTGDFTNNISAINSTPFVYNNINVMLADNGSGTLFLYYLSNDKKIVVNPNVGSVNYKTGEIVIQDLLVMQIPNNRTYIDLEITPKESDVIVLRNQILLVEDQDIKVDVVDLNKLRLS